MSDTIQFETPEHVRVQYTPAGLGTRFLAWFVDQLLLIFMLLLLIVLLTITSASVQNVIADLIPDSQDFSRVNQVFVGLVVVIMGLGSFVYFTLLELWWRGQTMGKRLCRIRVVKADGFALDPTSILLRNIFRVLDQIPLLWVIPVMSKRSQRSGDMVGGTIVVSDAMPAMTEIRSQLSQRSALEAQFRFDSRALQRLAAQDLDAIEQLLERWTDLPVEQRDLLVEKLAGALAVKLQMEPPAANFRVQFLQDLFAAELRRQSRLLA